METIKTSDDVSFDVIYADNTRHHVKEGILFEVDGDEMISHNGTDRLNVLFAVCEGAMELIDFIGACRIFAKGLKSADPDVPAKKALDKIVNAMYFIGAEKQAIFKLGQMDMQASACEMLRKLADAAAPRIKTGLNLAADLVEELEVMNADTGE